MFSSDDYSNITESWYSGKGQYRTTTSGRKVRWDEDDATDDRVSDMLQRKREEASKAAAKARLAAKGNLPIRKPKQNEEFESYVENLQNEGYDLSNWTWEGIEEFYIDEAKKMKGEDPCWKGYQMVGTKKKGGKEVPNCVPKEEYESEIDEEKKEFPKAKVERQIDRHLSNASSSWSSRGGKSNPRKTDSYKARYRKMSAIQGSVERGEDPRKDTVQGDQRKIFTKGYGTPVSAKTVDNEKSAYTPGGLRAHQTKAGGYRKLTRKEELEAVVEYLFVEGYSDSIESAEIMAESISETWINEILEEKTSD